MKPLLAGICVLLASASCATSRSPVPAAAGFSEATRAEVLELSRKKWQWMANRNVDSLENLFHPEAVFVHMGATMSRSQELNTIRSGGIQYKSTEISASSVRFAGTTAIVLNTIRLTAVVGGNEVVNPFEVTEVYVPAGGAWKLASLSFTRLLR